jgi:phosphatidylglycerophosphate synthase
MSVFKLRYLPNAICIVRIALTFPIVLYLVRGEYRIALVLIVIAGLSDGLDARSDGR